VRWTNEVGTPHTTTADGPLSLWDSLTMQHNDSFDFTFTAAGSYPYRCILHDGYGMVGRISIRDEAAPPSGPVGTTFTITVASVDAPTGFVYDIQKKNPGAGFRTWMTGVTTAQVTFDSTGQTAGTYQFKSRYRRVSDGAASLLSLAATITVTT
jgi:plastocyanin